jgi:hypothetical protein
VISLEKNLSRWFSVAQFQIAGTLMTLILSNQDVEKLLTMRECIEVLEEVYVELSEGRGVNRRRSDCLVPSTRNDALYSLKSMDGVIPKLGIGAVRIDSDIVTWPTQDNNMRRVKVPAAPNGRYVGVSIPRQSRGLYFWSRSKRLAGSLTRPRFMEPPKGGC